MLTSGDVFYMPPGQTAVVTKDMKFLDFSPEKGADVVIKHIAKKMAELSTSTSTFVATSLWNC